MNRQTDKQTDRQTNIWTFRLIESIGPEGRCFENGIRSAKSNFYRKMVHDLKDKDPGQWYKAVKRMTSAENHNEQLKVD